MASIAAKKAAVRQCALTSRDSIPASVRETRSLEICERIERILTNRFEAPPCGNLSHNTAGNRSGEQMGSTQSGSTPTAAKRQSFDSAKKDSTHPLIAVYCSMKSEVSLNALISWCFAKTWKVCFPCMMKDPDLGLMEFFTVDADQLQANAEFPHRVLHKFARAELERLGFELVSPEEIDAIVVPMTAFDACGNRLGYGGGNYDRYLPHLRTDALVMGAAFAEQQRDFIPADRYDLPLPLIVSA